MEISVKEFCKKYSENYSYLYNGGDQEKSYRVLVDAGYRYATETFKEIVQTVNEYRQDIFSSDREFAAFALTLAEYRII